MAKRKTIDGAREVFPIVDLRHDKPQSLRDQLAELEGPTDEDLEAIENGDNVTELRAEGEAPPAKGRSASAS